MSKSCVDLLDMDYINSLPQSLWVNTGGMSYFPIHDIDVQTGLLRIDVCGLLDVLHIGSLFTIRDGHGKEHYVGDFYTDPENWEERNSITNPKGD